MKLLLTIIVISATFIICTTSCSKDSGNKTAKERILGTWQVNNAIYHEHVDGVDNSDTTTGTADDKIDFRSDGYVYTYFQGIYDTSAYSVTSETNVTIDTQPYEIKTLTDNALTLYAKEISGDDYVEETNYFVR